MENSKKLDFLGAQSLHSNDCAGSFFILPLFLKKFKISLDFSFMK